MKRNYTSAVPSLGGLWRSLKGTKSSHAGRCWFVPKNILISRLGPRVFCYQNKGLSQVPGIETFYFCRASVQAMHLPCPNHLFFVGAGDGAERHWMGTRKLNGAKARKRAPPSFFYIAFLSILLRF